MEGEKRAFLLLLSSVNKQGDPEGSAAAAGQMVVKEKPLLLRLSSTRLSTHPPTVPPHLLHPSSTRQAVGVATLDSSSTRKVVQEKFSSPGDSSFSLLPGSVPLLPPLLSIFHPSIPPPARWLQPEQLWWIIEENFKHQGMDGYGKRSSSSTPPLFIHSSSLLHSSSTIHPLLITPPLLISPHSSSLLHSSSPHSSSSPPLLTPPHPSSTPPPLRNLLCGSS